MKHLLKKLATTTMLAACLATAVPDARADVYVEGNVNSDRGFKENTNGVKMHIEDGKYVATFMLYSENSDGWYGKFRFYNSTGNTNANGKLRFAPGWQDSGVTVGNTYSCTDISNYNDKGAWYINFGGSQKSKRVTIELNTDFSSFTITDAVPTVYIRGKVDGNEDWNHGIKLKKVNDITFESDNLTFKSGEEFKFYQSSTDNWYGTKDSEGYLKEQNNNLCFNENQTGKFTVTLNSSTKDIASIKFTPQPTKTITGVYLCGKVAGNDLGWDTSGTQLTQKSGTTNQYETIEYIFNPEENFNFGVALSDNSFSYSGQMPTGAASGTFVQVDNGYGTGYNYYFTKKMKGKFTVTVGSDFKISSVSFSGSEVVETLTTPEFKLFGNIRDGAWIAKDNGIPFIQLGENTWTLTQTPIYLESGKSDAYLGVAMTLGSTTTEMGNSSNYQGMWELKNDQTCTIGGITAGDKYDFTITKEGINYYLSYKKSVDPATFTVNVVGFLNSNGTWDGVKELTKQEDGHYIGHLKLYNEKSKSESWFRFQVKKSDGSIIEYGPSAGTEIKDLSQSFSLTKSEKSYGLPEGTYEFDVTMDGMEPTSFTVRKYDKIDAPKELYIYGELTASSVWSGTGTKLTKRGDKFDISLNNPGKNIKFRFASSSNGDSYNNVMQLYPNSQNQKIYSKESDVVAKTSCSDNPNKNWEFEVNPKGDKLYISVDFSGEAPVLYVSQTNGYERLLTGEGNYYVCGDINDWGLDEWKANDRGEIKGILRGTKLNPYKLVKTDDAPADQGGSDWYKLELKKFYGQFKIMEGNWDNQGWTYDYTKSDRTDNTIATGDYAPTSDYWKKAIKVKDVVNVVTQKDRNMHLKNNAILNATIWFNKKEGKLVIEGEPQDYYIFYGEEGNVSASGSMQTKINTEMPNTYNYVLPEGNDQIYVGNKNLTGLDWKGKKTSYISKEDLGNLVDGTLKTHTGIDDVDAVDWKEVIAAINTADGGNKLTGVYLVRIPAGFENPAGTIPFTISMTHNDNVNDKTYQAAIRNNHVYFFSGSRIHVRPDKDVFGDNVEVYYRVYDWDTDYKLKYLDFSHVAHEGKDVHDQSYVAWVAFPNQDDFEDSENANEGWVLMNRKVGANDFTHLNSKGEGWHAHVHATKENPDVEEVHQIPTEHSNAMVQYKFVVKEPSKVVSAYRALGQNAPSLGAKDYLVPMTLDFDYDNVSDEGVASQKAYTKLNGSDIYYTPGIETGVEEIEVDNTAEEIEDAEGPDVYYNLQGLRVENPEEGIYIKVTGKKSEKVVLKK